MPEIKNIFHKGIMNKDLDERLVPNGQFRDAMNIQVSTSEGSDIGTVQNVLGNVRVDGLNLDKSCVCVSAIADEKNNVFYWFIASLDNNVPDAIIEYNNNGNVTPILVDVNKNVLNFDPNNLITGINIIDNLLFWTDNINEPKKINIDTFKLNSHTDLTTHSDMFVEGNSVGQVTEDHITVVRKRPQRAPTVQFENSPMEPIIFLPAINLFDLNVGDTFSYLFDRIYGLTSNANPLQNLLDFPYGVGEEFIISQPNTTGTLPANYEVKLSVDSIGPPILNSTSSTGVVAGQGAFIYNGGPPSGTWTSAMYTFKIEETEGGFQNVDLDFNATQIPETKPVFEKELIRFATRWKYADGEYSAYSPFTTPIFLAGQFYFHPTDDPFNHGMESKATSLLIKDFVRNDTPEDVVQVDILFKKERSTVIYSIDSIKRNANATNAPDWDDYDNNQDGVYLTSDFNLLSANLGPTLSLGPNVRGKSGYYRITTENIYAALPDNQMLRPWDNVPRKALSQEITANRIVYANYLQNYNLRDLSNDTVTPWIEVGKDHRDYLRVGGGNSPSVPVTFSNTIGLKSIKSLRNYYLGVVYGDRYGRETPVLTSKDASISIPFDFDPTVLEDFTADKSLRLTAKLIGEQPEWAHYFKYFIKQTTGEYYNLTMDRVYKAAGDDNLWISFPSSDRNKIQEGDYFSIKKQVDIEQMIPVENRIKIIDIKNEAPETIKFNYVEMGTGGGNQTNLDALFTNISAQPAEGVKRLVINKEAWVDIENGLELETLTSSEKLAVQFTIISSGNTIFSEKYFVSGFSVQEIGSSTQDLQYNLVLRKPIQAQDSWVEESVGVLNANDGLSVTIYKLEEKPSVEFEGRFFVKIISNPVTQTYINPSLTATYGFQVLGVAKVFSLIDYLGVWGTNVGVFNTINQWTASEVTTGSNIMSNTPNDWEENTRFDTNIVDSEGWFFDYTTFAAAQSDQNIHAHLSGRMWKGNVFSNLLPGGANGTNTPSPAGEAQYVNGLEGLVSPQLTGGTPTVTSVTTVDPPYYNSTGSRIWSSTVINPSNDYGWDPAVPISFHPSLPANTPNPGYQTGMGNFDNTYDPVDSGGHWIHLSFACPGVDLHDNSGWSSLYSNLLYNASTKSDVYKYIVQSMQKIRTNSFWVDGIDDHRDGYWSFPSVPGNGDVWNNLLQPEKDDTLNQWEPGYKSADGSAQAVVNKLVPGTKFMMVGDDTTIYTIRRRHVKRLYNHTAFNPSPRVNAAGKIKTYPNKDYGKGSVAHWVQKFFDDYDNYGGIGPALSNGTGWPGLKTAIYNFGKANNRRTCYILQVNKEVAAYDIQWDDDNDPNSVTVIGNAPYTSTESQAQIIRFVDDYIEPGQNTLPTSPAIFETEAKENQDLNIYYEASDALPIGLTTEKGYLLAPIGTKVTCSVNNSLIDYETQNDLSNNDYDLFLKVKGWDGDIIELFGPGLKTNPGGQALTPHSPAAQSTIYNSHYLWFWREDGSYTTAVIEDVVEISPSGAVAGVDRYITRLRLRANSHQEKVGLSYYNCFSFGNGVESNRVRDDFNESFILNGVKASTVLEEPYEEERRKYGLIYSGLYNSTSGINNLNQFIQAEKITKDLMPSYGSIQKLYARDKDLITLCEDKIIRIYVDKDILYNADGNTQLLATNRVLGTADPFRGNFGISTNPESFAAESFRAYFTDKQRGAVLRLSMDGLTPISDAGMHNYFRDNLIGQKDKLIGSYDAYKGNYNLTFQPLDAKKFEGITVTYNETSKGWVSFKSFVPEFALSSVNQYYTMIGGEVWQHHVETNPETRNVFYNNHVESSVTPILNKQPDVVKHFNTLNYEGSQTKVDIHLLDDDYYNLYEKKGWYVEEIYTDKQSGNLHEFIEKEGKWFNYIKGKTELLGKIPVVDTAAFNFQGLGMVNITPTAASWNCDNNTTCADPGDGSGVYASLSACLTDCGVSYGDATFNCINNTCTDPGDGSGTYGSLLDCYNNCSVGDTWDCDVVTGCYDPMTGLGAHSTLADCVNNCSGTNPSFNCVNGLCVDPGDGSGQYPTFNSCNISCTPVITPSWDCVNTGADVAGASSSLALPGACVDPGDGSGAYTTLAACQAACSSVDPSWACIEGGCADPGTGLGPYTSLAQCVATGCGSPPLLESWDCIITPGVINLSTNQVSPTTYNCVDPGTGLGQYSSLAACQGNCGSNPNPNSWDCDGNGNCSDPGTGNGTYSSLAACQSACIVPSWDCDGQGNCFDPGTGNGQYASLSVCQTNCQDPATTSWDCKECETLTTCDGWNGVMGHLPLMNYSSSPTPRTDIGQTFATYEEARTWYFDNPTVSISMTYFTVMSSTLTASQNPTYFINGVDWTGGTRGFLQYHQRNLYAISSGQYGYPITYDASGNFVAPSGPMTPFFGGNAGRAENVINWWMGQGLPVQQGMTWQQFKAEIFGQGNSLLVGEIVPITTCCTQGNGFTCEEVVGGGSFATKQDCINAGCGSSPVGLYVCQENGCNPYLGSQQPSLYNNIFSSLSACQATCGENVTKFK